MGRFLTRPLARFIRGIPFTRYAWGVTIYNLAVILWGAVVRITGSGAGCADEWPTCQGGLIPTDAASTDTLIEFAHRATSGLSVILAILLVIKAFMHFPRGHRVRRLSVATFIFLMAEAALGAALVIFGLVVDDRSPERAVVVALHLVNTLGLVGFGALTAYASSVEGQAAVGGGRRALWIGACLAMILTSMTGAVTALGDTLFPVEAIAQGLVSDDHFLVRLRIVHPVVGLLSGLYFWGLAFKLMGAPCSGTTRRWAKAIAWLVLFQIIAGLSNVALGAPAWLQLVHLGLADTLWIAVLVSLASADWTAPEVQGPKPSPANE